MNQLGGRGDDVAETTPLELWRTLARAGPKATAETLTPEELDRLHVATTLDAFVAQRVREGVSIVLTGNAGDGKTHVMRRAKAQLAHTGAVIIEDATALMRGGDPKPVLDLWREAVAQGRPFCLAINEYPLYQLRMAADDFPPLLEVWRQCRSRLAYGGESDGEGLIDNVLVIDLSLRNPLAPSFFEAAIDSLLNDPSARAALTGDPDSGAARNARKLGDGRIRERLRLLLNRMVSLGGRATVREVWILVSRMIVGVEQSHEYPMSAWYFEPLFDGSGRFSFADIAVAVDPARCSHPQWDAALESRSPRLRDGWRHAEPPVPPHPTLDFAVFCWLKRAFYFEHDQGELGVELADRDAADFRDLLSRPRDGGARVTELVDAINAAYCPASFSGREHHLYLWMGHRFHEQPSRSYVAVERVGVDDLRLERPRLPARMAGAFDYVGDHLMLIAPGGARLRIDFPLFQTLRRLGRGLPRKLVPEREINRLDAFLETLGAGRTSDSTALWSVHLENLQIIKVDLSADRSRYETVRVNA